MLVGHIRVIKRFIFPELKWEFLFLLYIYFLLVYLFIVNLFINY